MKKRSLQKVLVFPVASFFLAQPLLAQPVADDPGVAPAAESKGKLIYGIKEFQMVPAEDGRTTYHIDKWRPTFSINAGDKTTHGKFARAAVSFGGKPGVYEVKITTITEFDGECQYRLLVDGKVVAEFKNPRVDKKGDMKPHDHVWKGISIPAGAEVAVESAVDSNGLIPEGDGFAFARGRWKALEFTSAK